MKRIIVMDDADNVATAIDDLQPGETILLTAGGGETRLEVTEPVPFAHKIALVALLAGSAVVKYGEVIGTVTEAIGAGGHVHVHNVTSNRVDARDRLAEPDTV